MSRMLTMMGLIVAILLGVAFAMDLLVGFPFQKASLLMDLGFIFAAALLGLISWMTLREVG
jgi:hypothetical protein